MLPALKHAMMLLVISASAIRALGTFETVDPMQWYTTNYLVGGGLEEIHLELPLDSPCKFDKHDVWDSVYGIKSTSYGRLEMLCEEDFTEVLEMLKSISTCNQ